MINWDYLTGFFDADGCVTIYNNARGYSYVNVSFFSTDIDVIERIKNFIQSHDISNKVSIQTTERKTKTMYRFTIGGVADLRKIIKYFLPRTNIDRKRMKLEEALKTLESKTALRGKLDGKQEEIRKLYWDDGLTVRETAKKLDSNWRTLTKFMRKHNIKRRKRGEKGTSAQVTSQHSESIEGIKERNLKSTMVKKALENYELDSGDELVVVYRQEEDAS